MSVMNSIFWGGLVLILGLGLQSCDNPKTPTNVQNGNPNESTPVSGATVFKKQCQICHGADGKLGLNGAKDLTQSTLSLEDRIAVIHSGRGTMTAFKEILSAEEIRAVATYTQTLGK